MTNKILIDRELLDSRIESLEDLVAISKTLPPKNWVDIIKNNTKKLRAALDAPQPQTGFVSGGYKQLGDFRPAQSVSEGWQLVPKEPTLAMVEAGANADPERESVWAAMLSAAPKAPTADDRKDAERYRWIQENYTAYDNNCGHWCARLEYLPCADSLGEAIDAAIAAQKGEKE